MGMALLAVFGLPPREADAQLGRFKETLRQKVEERVDQRAELGAKRAVARAEDPAVCAVTDRTCTQAGEITDGSSMETTSNVCR